MHIYLENVVACSQMSNPLQGTGTGGDRCTEAVMAMLDCTFKLGPLAHSGISPEVIMYDFTRWLNNGSDISAPEGDWITGWLASHTNGKVQLKPVQANPDRIVQAICNGHLLFVGLDNYARQTTYNGKDPYKWPEMPQHAEGHVELITGITSGMQWPAYCDVYDPLLGLGEMPGHYSLNSIMNAGWHLWEVIAPVLPVVGTF